MYQTSVDLTPCCIKHTHQGPSGTKVPRLDMCRSILSLSKIANRTIEIAKKQGNRKNTGGGVGGDREVGVGGWCWTKFEKRG